MDIKLKSQHVLDLLEREQGKLQERFQEGVRLAQESFRLQLELEEKKARQRLFQQAEAENSEMRTIIKKRILKFYDVLRQLGWPPHGRMNLAEAKKIVVAAEESGVAAVADAVGRYFVQKYNSKVISRILDSWGQKNALKERMEILEQAIRAHSHGFYYVSVPAILAQLEGIIADNFKHIGKMNGDELQGHLAKQFGDREEISLEKGSLCFYKLVLYEKFGHREPISSQFSRHAIIHGGDTRYGTEAGSLKAILTFDTLQALLLTEVG